MHFLWNIFGSFPVNQRKKFGQPLETAFSVSIEKLFKKTFGKQMKFSIIFRHWAEPFGLLSIFLRGLLELHSTCLREDFREKNVFQSLHFPKISDNKRNFFETLSEKFQRVCRKRKLQVQNNIFGHFFIRLFF